jgi:hypothetical protein
MLPLDPFVTSGYDQKVALERILFILLMELSWYCCKK